jgi:predicted nucleic acid-binding protein
MPVKALLETGFLLALNPRDRNHGWALSLLDRARRGEARIHISPAALVELALILRSRGLRDGEIAAALRAIDEAISMYTRPSYSPLTLEHVAYASELRSRHAGLTFFDSLHAAVAVSEGLEYIDLDERLRGVVEAERAGRPRPL